MNRTKLLFGWNKLWLILAFSIGLSSPLRAVELFPLNQVRILESEFLQAQNRNIDYVMAMDADRLLAPYLREAGLTPRALPYGNWESTGLDGHMGGHYVSALSMAWAATGREDVKQRLDYALAELQRAQQKNGNGYLGGVPGGKKLWRDIAAGDVKADLFGLNGAWVPWYNLHKIFAGLRDAYLYTGDKRARAMLIAFADWAATTVAGLSDEQMQAMLQAEYGGMNEVFADVAAITGEARYLKTAQRFSHQAILKPLLNGQDQLTGLHANTQIPKVVGFERVAEVAGDDSWHLASEYFWDTVVNERSVAIGGNSVREHFHDKNDFTPMVEEIEGPETCNTYNMLKLTQLLYQQGPDMKYVDYYERALYNHILSSQDPETGGLVYFTPMRPQHYRVYSQVDNAMWCCVGSGIENHMKYGQFIYAHDDTNLWVNLFIPSRLNWPEKNLSIRQETEFPDHASTKLVFESDSNVTLKLRNPSWNSKKKVIVRINGKKHPIRAEPGSYMELNRAWQKGDTIELELAMALRAEPMPDGLDLYAILFGPIVLAAKTDPFPQENLAFLADDSRMGHVASGSVCPVEEVPIFVAKKPNFTQKIKRMDKTQLRFTIAKSSGLQNLNSAELIPFYRLHRSRYIVYWPYSSPVDLHQRQQFLAQQDAAQRALDELTIDEVSPGEQQPEVEHNYSGSGAETGVNFNRHWRHASEWFGYTLADPELNAKYLRIDYWGADSGRTFTIEMNGIRVAEVTSTGVGGAEFVSVDYPLAEKVVAAAKKGRHEIRFVAAPGSIAGGIYGVRLLSGLPAENSH